jgi:hypothetical protein
MRCGGCRLGKLIERCCGYAVKERILAHHGSH